MCGDIMKDMNKIGVMVLLAVFLLFFGITTFLLNKWHPQENVVEIVEEPVKENNNYDNEKNIVNNLYKEIKIMYDVVNNRFKVSQDETITIGEVVYKKITNFDEVMNNVFTENGKNKYVEDLNSYFAYTEDGYYMASNLTTYQTYYFRGDNSNIYITSASASEINGIIYEKWTSNNKNTLATVKVVMVEGKWLVDRIDILSTE